MSLIRKIDYDESKILGYGSGGTVVFQGTLNGRTVAVKRMLLYHNHLAQNEILFLQKVDLHPNLINYYDTQVDKDFVFLAIEKCEGNLENLVELIKQVRSKAPLEYIELSTLFKIYQKDLEKLTTPDFIKSVLL